MDKRIHVISAGEFGQQVVKCLSELHSLARLTYYCRHGDCWDQRPLEEYQVVAANVPIFHLCTEVNRRCFEDRVTFVPVSLDSLFLRIGPLVVPGQGSCWECWVKRTLQHPTRPYEETLQNFYRDRECAMSFGYLAPFASVAAGIVSNMIQHQDERLSGPGTVWQMNVFTQEATTNYVIGINGCAFCWRSRSSDQRTYLELQRKISGSAWLPSSNAQSKT